MTAPTSRRHAGGLRPIPSTRMRRSGRSW
jgi:hypothetical protein